MPLFRTAALAALLVSGAMSATAVTLLVPQDHATIQAAVDAAQAGDVILVAKGTYDPFVVDGKTGITLKGKGKPEVDATGMAAPAAAVLNSSGIVLEGFVFRSPDDVGEADGVLVLSSTDVTIRKCTIEDIGSDGIRSSDSSGLLIEKCTIQRTSSDGIEFDEDDALLLPPPTASIIRKNKFLNIGDDGIDLDGNGHLVEKNTVDDTGSAGIKVEGGPNNVVEKNKIRNAGDRGVNVEGDDNLVVRNKISDGNSDGIRARGTRNLYEKNKIKNHDDGFDVEATDSEFIGNKISNCGDHGFDIGSSDNPTTGNLVEGNKISKCDQNGIYVHEASNNTFRGNKAKKNGGFDLLDETGVGTNIYEGNKFGTESVVD